MITLTLFKIFIVFIFDVCMSDEKFNIENLQFYGIRKYDCVGVHNIFFVVVCTCRLEVSLSMRQYWLWSMEHQQRTSLEYATHTR